jgi:hypothetical protein
MSDHIKRKIKETVHYKLVRVTYLDFGYMSRCRYRHYNIVEKSTNKLVGMFSDLKLAKLELQNMEDNKTNE